MHTSLVESVYNLPTNVTLQNLRMMKASTTVLYWVDQWKVQRLLGGTQFFFQARKSLKIN